MWDNWRNPLRNCFGWISNSLDRRHRHHRHRIFSSKSNQWRTPRRDSLHLCVRVYVYLWTSSFTFLCSSTPPTFQESMFVVVVVVCCYSKSSLFLRYASAFVLFMYITIHIYIHIYITKLLARRWCYIVHLFYRLLFGNLFSCILSLFFLPFFSFAAHWHKQWIVCSVFLFFRLYKILSLVCVLQAFYFSLSFALVAFKRLLWSCVREYAPFVN